MFNFNKKNKIGTNPSPTFEKPEFLKRESQLPLPKNKVPMPECKSLLEKEVRYKEKYWFVRINDNLIEIYDSKEKDKTVGHQLYAGIINDSDLISETKKAIKQAYIITCQTNKYEDFKNWDGNMDNELPEIQP